jgi:MFS family permease
MPPFWFWLIVLGIIILYIYILKTILKIEEEYVPPSAEDILKWKIIQLRFFEIIAWIFVATGFLIYVYGILHSSPLIIFFIGSGLAIASYLVAAYYRKQRRAYQEKLKEKQQPLSILP